MNAPVIVTAPAGEPITRDEAKRQVRVELDDSSHDTVLDACIKAARAYAENFCNRSFCKRTYRLTLDEFPKHGCPLYLPMSPVLSVDHVKYYDSDGTLQTWSSAEYLLESDGVPGRLFHHPDYTWPTDLQVNRLGLAQVQYAAGYAPSTDSPTDYAASVPADVKDAIKLIVADLFEHRESTVVGAPAMKLPRAAEDLLWPYRILRG